MKRSTLAALAATFALVVAPASHADLELSETGAAALGKLTTVTITGNPGDKYLLVLSLVNAGVLPTPHQPPNIDVGLELISLSFTIPGWLGTIGPGGTAQAFLPFPADITLNPLTLYMQALQHDGVLFTGKSNPCTLTPNLPLFTEPTMGDMEVLRAGHTMTELPDGRFLIIGGGADGMVASYGQTSMETYDPCTQTFTKVGDLLAPRTSHTSTLLQDGRILVVGGADDILGEPVDTAEVVDPANNFASTATNVLSMPRALHGASLLPDGRVLVTGGTSSFNSPQDIVTNSTETTEIWNPNTNSWSAGPNMSKARVGQSTNTLDNDQVLVAGGFSHITIIFVVPFVTDDAEIYTPVAGQPGSFGPPILMTQDRFAHNSIKLSTGSILLFGGAQDVFSDPFNPVATNTVEVFNPNTGSFSFHGTMTIARGGMAVCLLPNDLVIVAGGAYGSIQQPIPDDTVDVYNGVTGTTQIPIQMQHVRGYFTATCLPNGAMVLIGGGEEGPVSNPLAFDDAELLTLP